MHDHRRVRVAQLATALIALALGLIAPGRASAATGDPVSAEQQLADKYAPVVMLQKQPEPCSSQGEPYSPMAVDSLLGNPEIALRQVGRGDPIVKWAPTASDLFRLGGAFYLDFPGQSLNPGCIYEQDYRRYNAGHEATVYAHTLQEAGHPDQYVLQYWFWWYYNDWGNTHEGDWEHIQIVFPASSAEEALQVDPTSVGYSQHEGGERADWTSDKLEREGSRIVVYPSAGSHASYFNAALYLGRNGNEGFGCDDTGGEAVRMDPDIVLLPDSVDDRDDPLAWLAFDGRWGERERGPFNGPTGPADKGRWERPIEWQDNLRSSSVVIPAGDGAAESLANAFCRGVEIGSDQLIAFKLSPMRAVVTIALFGGLLLLLIRKTTWNKVPPLPVVRRRAAGQIIRMSPRVLARAPVTFAFIALGAVPLALFTGIVVRIVRTVPLLGRLVTFSDSSKGVRFIISFAVGSLANVVAMTVIIALVAWTMGELSAGRSPTIRDALTALVAHARPLLGGLARAVAIVVVSFVTIIGIPFGIHRLVSYQFFTQAVMLEDLDGAAALRRGVRLVRGRWWRTAIVLGLISLTFTIVVSTIAMALLIVARPPFWALSLFITFAELLVVPVVAIASTLLYGSAVSDANDEDAEPPSPDPAIAEPVPA
jgi:hypothetical protein